MKRLISTVFIVSLVMLTAFTQERPTVQIVNNTGYTVYYAYLSQTASDDWYEDVLGDEVLESGEYVTTRLLYPLDVTNRYDIKLVDEDGDSYIKWDVLITPDSRIEFTMSDYYESAESTESTATDLPTVQVLNNTGYTVYYAYISQTATDDWQDDVLGSSTLDNGEYVTITLSYPLTVVNRYDIKLVDEDGDAYIKWDVLVTPGSSIEFTFDDIE